MSVFTYHLVKIPCLSALKAMIFRPDTKNIQGLIHLEYMTCMTLGSPVFSLSRILIRQVAVFAQWENEACIDAFFQNHKLGKTLKKGWHTRLKFIRQWGKISGFEIPEEKILLDSTEEPVVAITLARMRMLEVPRFIRWGRPVEKLVRDHTGTTLSLASITFPRTVSTFSIWKTQKEMTDMVFGHSKIPEPSRHKDAMKERERKDFHLEFTTLRFKAISEFGSWKGQKNYIPNLKASRWD